MSYSLPRYMALKCWPPDPRLDFFKAMSLKILKSVPFPGSICLSVWVMGVFSRCEFNVKKSQVPTIILCIWKNADFASTNLNTAWLATIVDWRIYSDLTVSWGLFWQLNDFNHSTQWQWREQRSILNNNQKFFESLSRTRHVSCGFWFFLSPFCNGMWKFFCYYVWLYVR